MAEDRETTPAPFKVNLDLSSLVPNARIFRKDEESGSAETSRPWEEYHLGFPRFAAFIAEDKDKSTTIYRRFERLAARTLLLMESELAELEKLMDELDDEYARDNFEVERTAVSWQAFGEVLSKPGFLADSRTRAPWKLFHEETENSTDDSDSYRRRRRLGTLIRGRRVSQQEVEDPWQFHNREREASADDLRNSTGHRRQEVDIGIPRNPGANVKAEGDEYENDLQAARRDGEKRLPEALPSIGSNVNTKVGEYGHALRSASSNGNWNAVEGVDEKQEDINAKVGEYGNALQAASINGNLEVVEALLEKRADVNAQGGLYGNALQAASYIGDSEVVERLLEKGADVNAQGGRYGSALQAACSGGHRQIAKRLLEAGADINALGGRYGSALEAARRKCHRKIVELLLSRGAHDRLKERREAHEQAINDWHKTERRYQVARRIRIVLKEYCISSSHVKKLVKAHSFR
jgi:hypothetical protein